MNILFLLSILSGIIALVCLIALHFTSPEYQPSWRMISEYAMGKYKWLITLFFYLWGISSIVLALGLSTIVSGFGAYLGIGLLIISGIGAICGGVFDVNHKNHGLAFALGVPTLPIAAVLLTYHLINSNSISQKNALVAAHATWISVIIMAISMMHMFSGFKKAGITWDKDAPPPAEIPKGVIALGGYANRLLVFCYLFWSMYIGYLLIK